MAMTMPVLREHLTQRQLSVGGNKQTLARRLLMDLQSGQEPEQTSHESVKKVKVSRSPQLSRLHSNPP